MNAISTRMGVLMADDLRELYRSLGAVETNTETIKAGMGEMKADLKELKEIKPDFLQMKDYIAKEVKPEIDGLKRSRWIRHGITIGLGTASGIGGSVVAKIPGLASLLHIP